jgi:Tfp pilus assembly protein PilF
LRYRVPALLVPALLALGPALLAQSHPDADSRYRNGLAHLQQGQTSLAVEEFQAAIKEDPKNPYYHKGLGIAYAQQGKHKEAIDMFRRAIELNPYYVDVRNDLGASLLLTGKREEGKKEFKIAYEDPTNPTPEVAARNLGQASFEEKRYAEAASWFQSSLAKNKAYPDAYLGLADVLTAEGKSEEALARLEAGAANCPADINIGLALGVGYYRAGRFTEAKVNLEKVAQKDPAGDAGRKAVDLLKNLPK